MATIDELNALWCKLRTDAGLAEQAADALEKIVKFRRAGGATSDIPEPAPANSSEDVRIYHGEKQVRVNGKWVFESTGTRVSAAGRARIQAGVRSRHERERQKKILALRKRAA